MIVLITGSFGFLGRHCADRLEAIGDWHILKGTTSFERKQDGICFDTLYRNISSVLDHQKVDAIAHFAAVIPASFSEATYQNTLLPNMEMMNHLYDFSIQSGIKKFVYISTFGSMQDPSNLDVADFYTLSKITGEHFCSMMSRKGIAASSLRIPSPYGEHSRIKNVLRIFIDKALAGNDLILFGSGTRKQNFIYAGDIAGAVEKALMGKAMGIYDIVSESSISMRHLAEMVIDLTGSQSKIVVSDQEDPQESYQPVYSYAKAYADFGFKPETTLAEGLKKYIAWIKSQ